MTGQRLGSWVLEAELGRGAVGVVYRASATDGSGRIAALKVLTHSLTLTPEFLARFPADMLALHRLHHPNIVAFYEAGTQAGQAWYAMELVEGVDLGSRLRARPRPTDDPGLPWAGEAISVAVQITRALKHGHHRSILHRDLKPSNVLIRGDGVVKVSNFGVAKVLGIPPLSLPSDGWGSVGFLPPELFSGKPLTRRSDLYMLGGVVYAALTGRPLFTASAVSEFLHKHCYMLPERPIHFVPDLPTDLDDLTCELLAKDPGRRPASAAAVLEALDHLRGKAERKGKRVTWPVDPGDKSEPMPALVESSPPAESTSGRGRPLMSRPSVVVPLFALVVAVILVLSFWPRPSAEELFRQAEPLLASEDPADWETAWSQYLEPLHERYPDRYVEEVAAARQRIADRREQDRAVATGSRVRYQSEGERLYQRGLKLVQAGEYAAADRVWAEMERLLTGLPAEDRWVRLARQGRARLVDPSAHPGVSDRGSLASILTGIAELRAAGKRAEADAKLAALTDLFRDDPEVLRQIQNVK